MRRRGHSQRAARWLISVHAFDDTGHPIAPYLTVSEAIYQDGTEAI